MNKLKQEVKRIDKLCNKYHTALMIACELLETHCDPDDLKYIGATDSLKLVKRLKYLIKEIRSLEKKGE